MTKLDRIRGSWGKEEDWMLENMAFSVLESELGRRYIHEMLDYFLCLNNYDKKTAIKQECDMQEIAIITDTIEWKDIDYDSIIIPELYDPNEDNKHNKHNKNNNHCITSINMHNIINTPNSLYHRGY